MKILLLALYALVPAVARAQGPDAKDPLRHLARTARRDLDESVATLNGLREAIANERLPLAEELTSLEERLTRLRADNERVTRGVDAGSLELVALKSKIKSRQDELDYVGNLLDEYARTLETKLGPSESQYCGKSIEQAKQATENTTLTRGEKLTPQLALVSTSVKRLFDLLGGMRFPGIGVDLQGTILQGQFAILGPITLFRAQTGAAGVVVPQSGSSLPLIRPLDGALQTNLANVVESGQGLLPLDPSRGGALKALVQRTNIVHVFEKGGPIMWPLLAASILALGTVIERLIFLANERRKRDDGVLEAIYSEVGKGNVEVAVSLSRQSTYFVARALGYALEHREKSLAHALTYAQAQELKRFKRGIPILDTVITLAPLLGLLGTVTGMMGSFSLLGGELNAPGAITGGIAEALIATAFGLGIAITALLPFNFLNARLDEASHELESAAKQLELLVRPTLVASRSESYAPPTPTEPQAGEAPRLLATNHAAAVTLLR